MSSSCRAAGVPALGVATNKHGQIRKMGEQNILDYDRSLSGGIPNNHRDVNKMLQAQRPHTAPEDAVRPSNSLGSLGGGFRPGSAANSRPDKGDFVQSSNSLRSLYDGLRPGSATQAPLNTLSTGTPFATLNSIGPMQPASSLDNVGEGLRPASAANSRQNKANPVQTVNNAAQVLSSVGSPGNGLRPGSAANGLRPRSAAGTLPNKANQVPNSNSLGSLTDAMRPGSAANARANKGNSLQPLSSFGSAGDGLRPRSAANTQPNRASPVQQSSGFAESLQAGNSAALPLDKGSPWQPSNNVGIPGDGLQPGSAANPRLDTRGANQPSQSPGNGLQPAGRIGDLLTNYHDEPLKASKASKASKSTQWLEPSKLLGDLMKKQSQSRASTTAPSTSKSFGLSSDDEHDQGFAMRSNSFGKSRRPNSSQRRTARLQKKKPGAKVGSGGMFMPTGQCFPFQIGETPSCSAFGNTLSKEPPAAGFKYWRDFKGSGGHFLGM